MASGEEKRMRRLAAEVEALRRRIDEQETALRAAIARKDGLEGTSRVMSVAIMCLASTLRDVNPRRLDETVEAFAAVMPVAEATDLLRNLCSQSEAAGHSIN